jgi:membrane associated rhomboid family serine protease
MDCPRCEGTGLCHECKGAGSIECPTCTGIGTTTTSRGQSYPCRSCAGKGRLDCSTACASCEGTGKITSDLQKRMRDKYELRPDNTSPLQTASFLLVFVNVVVLLLQSNGPPVVKAFFVRWCYDNQELLLRGEVWRLVTPMFLHVGWLHLAMNCYFLLLYCPVLEGLYGTRRFLALYFTAGIAGNLASWVGNCWLAGGAWAGVGASTSLMGVAAAYIGLHQRWGIGGRDQAQGWAVYIALVLVAGFAIHGLDNWGHLGGALGGLAFGMLSRRPVGR